MTLPPDFLDGAYLAGHPAQLYHRLLREEPYARWPDPPLLVLSRYRDVHAVASDPVTFCSSRGILVTDLSADYAAPPTIMHTDPPTHTRYRSLVAPAFRPSLLRGLEEAIRQRVTALLTALPYNSPVDVVPALAEPLPMQVICDLLGLPASEWRTYVTWSEVFVPGASQLSPEEASAARTAAVTTLLQAAKDPRDDGIISLIARSEIDGDRLSDAEILMFLIQLLVAGNETTRHAISGGLLALATHPGQWEAASSLSDTVEEILRWTSPVVSFLRTATQDTTIGDQPVASGERIMLLYGAASRDPEHFGPTADVFDVTRAARPNLAFGFGPHFCLGAALARMELRILLEELRIRVARMELTGDVTWNGSAVVTGPRSVPMIFRSQPRSQGSADRMHDTSR